MPKQKRFTFNDENIKNSHGFYVLTDGISTERFTKNPICLKDHSNRTKDVLGKWVDIEKANALMLGTPEFDTKDTEGLEVVRKVENDIILSCSMGIRFNPEDLKMIGNRLTLTKCDLMEVSIVAVPSNANAIVLYNQDNKQLTAEEIQNLCLSAKTQNTKTNIDKMDKVIAHLQLADNADQTAVLTAVKEIESNLSAVTTERDNYKKKYDDLLAEQEAELQAEYDTEKGLALKDGRLDADAVKHFDTLSETNLSNALNLLKTLPKRKSVKEQMGNDADSPLLKLSWNELDKNGQLAELKALNFEVFKEKYKEEFKTDYKEQ